MPETPDDILLIKVVDSTYNQQEIDKLLIQIGRVDKAIQAINSNKISFGNAAGLKDIKAATDSLNQATQKLNEVVSQSAKVRQTSTQQQLDEVQKLERAEQQAYAKRQAADSEQAESAALERERLRQRNLELKNTAIANAATEGSIQQMRAQLSLLTQEYDKLGAAERNSGKGTELQNQIKGQADALFKLESETGRYSRNVGNYTQATKILEQSLNEVKQKMDAFTNSGKGSGDEFNKLQREEALLNQILNKNVEGFASLTQEIRANERALATMFNEGLAGSEAYRKLETEVSNAKRELGEFREQQKLLSSQTPLLSAATLAAKGLAGAYAVGAGAAALFADGDEKVQKELQKLVAIMTVLQGLQEVHELLEKKGTVAKIASAAADKLSAAWIAIKNFALRGTIGATNAATEATIVNTTATEGATVATRLFAGSMVGLRVALLATGIGALLLLIPSIAAAMSKASKETDGWEGRLKRLKQIDPEVAASLEELGKTIEEVADNYIKKLEEASKDLRAELGLIPSDARIATEVLNGLIEKRGELQKSLESHKKTLNFGDLFGIGQSQKDIQKQIDGINNTIDKTKTDFDNAQLQKARELGRKNLEQTKSEAGHLLDMEQELGIAQLKAKGATEKQIFEAQQKYQQKRIGLITTENQIAIASYQAQLDAVRSNSPWDTGKISELQTKINELNQETKDASNKLLIDQYNFKAQQRDKDKKSEKDYLEDLYKYQKELSDKEFELRNKKRQAKIDDDKAFVESDKETLVDRLKAQELFYNDSLQLLNAQRTKELEDSSSKTDEEKRIIERELKNKNLTAKQRKDLMDTLAVIQKKGDLDIQNIETNHLKAIEDLNRDNGAKITEIKISDAEKQKSALSNQHETELQNLANEYEQEVLVLDQNYAKKKNHTAKEEREYQEAKLKLQEEYQIKQLQSDIEYTKSVIDLAEVRAKASGKQEDQDAVLLAKSKLRDLEIKLAQAQVQLHVEQNNQENKSDEELFKEKMARLEKYASYAKEVQDIIGGFVEAGVTKQKNEIQSQIDLLDKRTAKEIDAANQSALSEQDKAAKIAIINAKAQAQKEALQKRQQQLDEKKARFDKAAGIANIIEDTAIAVIRALGDKTVPYPVRLGYAITAGVIGAAQIAKAIATPIPKYFKGKNVDDFYEGPAWVGDGGKAEVIIRENGNVEKTPAVPTLTYVGKKDIILPDAKMLAWSATTSAAKKSIDYTVNNSFDSKEIVSELKVNNRLLKSIKNKQPIKVYKTDPLDSWMNGKINTNDLFGL